MQEKFEDMTDGFFNMFRSTCKCLGKILSNKSPGAIVSVSDNASGVGVASSSSGSRGAVGGLVAGSSFLG